VPARIYLDTSFLMLSAKFHLDVLREAERLVQTKTHFFVPSIVVAELKQLAERSGAQGRDARVALELLRRCQISHAESGNAADADAALIQASQSPGAIVATADLPLRRKLRNAGRPVIFLREKAKLELEGIEAGYW
jgi:rRNA-processing protein FCF1